MGVEFNGSKQRKQRKSRGRKQKSERHQHQPYIFSSSWKSRITGGCRDVLCLHACDREVRPAACWWLSFGCRAYMLQVPLEFFSIFMLLFGVNLRDESREIQMGVYNLDDVMFLAVTGGPSPGFLYTRLCVL